MNQFNPYAAGKKRYEGIRNSPHVGGGLDPAGYKIRDRRAAARRRLRRLKAAKEKNYMSSDYLTP